MAYTKGKTDKFDFPSVDYREPFICPFHNCLTQEGWCWECAIETYGYDKANQIFLERRGVK